MSNRARRSREGQIPGYTITYAEMYRACECLIAHGWGGLLRFDEAVAALVSPAVSVAQSKAASAYPPPFGKEEDCICSDAWRRTRPANHCDACVSAFEATRSATRRVEPAGASEPQSGCLLCGQPLDAHLMLDAPCRVFIQPTGEPAPSREQESCIWKPYGNGHRATCEFGSAVSRHTVLQWRHCPYCGKRTEVQ